MVKNKKHKWKATIAFRLWCVMLLLIILVVGAMWIVQVIFLEKNYINSAMNRVQKQINPVMEELKIKDLAYDDELLAYISQATDGKMLLIGPSGDLIAMYTYGHPIDLSTDTTETQVWVDLQMSEDYENINAGKTYNKIIYAGRRVKAYEIGIPVMYHGKEAYMVLYHSFTELYTVLDMNCNQLILITIMLTILASVIAIFLSRSFTHPIRVIRNTVDQMAKGDLTASTGITLHDELGDLSKSVEKLGEELQRVDVLRKEVIANVSHELRAPLAIIRGYAEMVRDINWKKDEQREADLNLIIQEANRMSEMVTDILDYSQLQSGYLQLKKETCNLYELVEAQLQRCEVIANENHIGLKLVNDKDASNMQMLVCVDVLKMNQVIRNLVYNAINHTADGDVIEIRIEANENGTAGRKKEYKVSIINPGEPIPEEDQEIIWERYQRSQHQGSRRQGTGIGLSIVSTILNAHDMTYGVDCNEGKTCFWFAYEVEEVR